MENNNELTAEEQIAQLKEALKASQEREQALGEKLNSFENLSKDELQHRAEVAEEGKGRFRQKFVEKNAELSQLRDFIGDKNPKLIDTFDQLQVPDKEQKLGKFEQKIQSIQTRLLKEEAKLSIGNKEYANDNLKFYADQNRANKGVLGRATAVASTKIKRAIHDFTQSVSEKKEKSVEAVGKGAAYAGNATATVGSYAAGVGKAGWDTTGKKLVDFAKDKSMDLKGKVQSFHKVLDTKLTMMEQKAGKDPDFEVGKKSSVIARAASLGTQKVKDNLSKQLETVKETTKEGFNKMKEIGKGLVGKFVNAAKTVHNAGMEGVNKREEKKKDQGVGL